MESGNFGGKCVIIDINKLKCVVCCTQFAIYCKL